MKFLEIWFYTFILVNLNIMSSSCCSWTECIPSTNISLSSAHDDINCPNQDGEATQVKACASENDEGGYMLYCCSQNDTDIQKGPKSNFMWWPNDFGVLMRASVFCPFPQSLQTNDSVNFFLYTKNNTDVLDYKEIMVDDEQSLRSSGFNKDAPVKLIIHGFMSRAWQGPAKALREDYTKLPYQVNVVAVDWSRLANYAEGPTLMNPLNYVCYGAAAESTPFVGLRSALFLEFLIKQKYTEREQIHVMGHSLGAHCAGHTGKRFTMGKLPRITGFDPAGPAFRNVESEKRIDHTDAEFVDILHTSTTGGEISMGLKDQLGHADFYPNTGAYQPGCSAFPPFVYPEYPPKPTCSHSRAYDFYGESINPPTNSVFRGILCNSVEDAENGKCDGEETDLMGACTQVNNRSRSIYFLRTNAVEPFELDEVTPADNSHCLLN